jgi:hypothetical protein
LINFLQYFSLQSFQQLLSQPAFSLIISLADFKMLVENYCNFRQTEKNKQMTIEISYENCSYFSLWNLKEGVVIVLKISTTFSGHTIKKWWRGNSCEIIIWSMKVENKQKKITRKLWKLFIDLFFTTSFSLF